MTDSVTTPTPTKTPRKRKAAPARTMSWARQTEQCYYLGTLRITTTQSPSKISTDHYNVFHFNRWPGEVYEVVKVGGDCARYTVDLTPTLQDIPALATCTCLHGQKSNRTKDCKHVAALLTLRAGGKLKDWKPVLIVRTQLS